MPAPTIEVISEQFIAIDTDYSLEIDIANDPVEVTVGGLLEGFYYSWDADSDTLTIAGEATRLLNAAIWEVSAKETATSTPVTSEIVYNVVPSAPIIEEVGEQSVLRGGLTHIFLEVQNNPTQLMVDGLLIGLKSEPHTERTEVDMVEGILISGTLPRSTNLTVDSTNFNVFASNDGSEDTYVLPILITDTPPIFVFDDTDDDWLAISPTGSLLWTYDAIDATSDYLLAVHSDGTSYLGNKTNRNLYKVRSSGSLLWTYDIASSGVVTHLELDSDGNAFVGYSSGIFTNSARSVYKVNSATGMLDWTFSAGTSSISLFMDNEGNAIVGRSSLITKVSGEDGSSLWTYSFSRSIRLIDSENGIILYSGSQVRKVNSSGVLQWTNTGVSGGSSFYLDGDDDIIVFFGSNIRKIDGSTGGTRWDYSGSFDTFGYEVGIDDTGNAFVLRELAGILTKISGSTGNSDWTYTFPSGDYRNPIGVDSDGNVFVFDSTNNNLYKVSSSGSLLWTYSAITGEYGALTVLFDDGVLLYNETNDNFYKVSSSGSLSWTYDAPAGEYTVVLPEVDEEE